MPWLSSHPCRDPGCGVLIRGRQGRCEKHRRATRRRQEEGRPSAHSRGYGADWRARRAQYLLEHPDCVRCGEPATEVDHIMPLSAGGADDEGNYQSLCKTCHSVKTGKVDRKR